MCVCMGQSTGGGGGGGGFTGMSNMLSLSIVPDIQNTVDHQSLAAVMR